MWSDYVNTYLDSSGAFRTPFTNDDPDDDSSVDLVIGIASQNDIIQINDIGSDNGATHVHTPGSIYTYYSTDHLMPDVSGIGSRNSIVFYPKVVVDQNEEISMVYGAFESITKAHEYIRSEFGYDAPRVILQWWDTADGSFYRSSTEPNYIQLDSDHITRNAIALHEYGHHIMRSVYEDNAVPYPPRPGCTSHSAWDCFW